MAILLVTPVRNASDWRHGSSYAPFLGPNLDGSYVRQNRTKLQVNP